jgi:hypothetical protein
MTSRSGPVGRRLDRQLDLLIRCSLRERVAGTSPSPDAWRRIHASARRTGGLWQAVNRLTYHFEAVGIFLSGADSAVASRESWGSHWGSPAVVRYDQHWSPLNRHQVLRLVA